MANTTNNQRLRCAMGRLTVAQVNADTPIVPPKQGYSYIVVGGWFIATGSAATATSVDVVDTSDNVAVAVAVGNLTNGTLAPFNAASGVTWTTYGTALTAGEGLHIHTAGGDLGTTTQLDYYVEYTAVPS
jgi:hypothetical protein